MRKDSRQISRYMFQSSVFFGKEIKSLRRRPFHAGFCSWSRIWSATSPGRMTVQVMKAEILTPGPESPRMSPAIVRILFLHCSPDSALSRVWGSSMSPKSGRMLVPSALMVFMPRMRPVMPTVFIIAPLALLPRMVGRTISSDHEIKVRSPQQSWPAARLLMPLRARIG